MKYRTDHVFELEHSDQLSVCNFSECANTKTMREVALSSLNHTEGGDGFAIHFTTGQLDDLRELIDHLERVALLERADKQEAEWEADPTTNHVDEPVA